MRKTLLVLMGLFCFGSLFAQLPIEEDFESYPEATTIFAAWENDTAASVVWQTEAGTTPSTGTGPSDDASGMGGIYAYMESSTPVDSGDQAILCLNATITGSNPALTFAYHMYGAATGSLEVTIDDGSGPVSAFLVVGEQQTDELDPYLDALVPLTAYIGQTIDICIIGTASNEPGGTISFTSDMAIDEILVGELSAADAEILGLEAPVDGCGLGTESVTVTAGNAGTDTLTSIDVSLTVDGGTTVTETIAVNIAPGGFMSVTLGASADLSALGPHELIVDIQSSGSDGNLVNGLDTFTVVNAVPAVLPVSDDFDSYSDGTNVFNDFQNIDNGEIWEAEVGNTGSIGTGPIDASDPGGTYIYIESSGAADGDEAKLQSPCLDLSSAVNPRLDFDYHMFGSSIGFLSVDVVSGGVSTNELLLLGQQDTSETDPWNSTSIDLSGYIGQSVVICITGQVIADSTSTTFRGDIALDNIAIVDPVSDDVGATSVSIDPCTGIVKVVVENYGSTAVTSIDASYSIDGGTPVMETIAGSLAPGDDTCYVFATTAALGTGTSTVDASASATSGDGNTSNDAAPQISATVIGDGYFENFDSYPEGETDLSPLVNLGAIDWETEAGTTTSTATGPSDDVTVGGNYIYMESSSPAGVGDQAVLEFCADLSGMTNAQLTYSYHMFGDAVGSLMIFVNGVAVDSLVGQQQTASADAWIATATDLSAYDGTSVTIQIVGTIGSTGTSFNSDIALDDICISEAPVCDVASQAAPANPTHTLSPDGTMVTVCWDAVPTADGYLVRGKRDGGSFVRKYTMSTCLTVPIQAAKGPYMWQVRAICADGSLGPFSSVDVINTMGPRVGDLRVGLMPNPANEQVQLNVIATEGSEIVYTISDLLGRVVEEGSAVGNGSIQPILIGTTEFNRGNYIVTVTSGEDVITQQLQIIH